MDRRCYEELLGERKNMELTYEDRIAQLQDQHAEVNDSSVYSVWCTMHCIAQNSQFVSSCYLFTVALHEHVR